MVIGIDCDCTLCDLQETVIRLFNERFGASYQMSDFTSYDIMDVMHTADATVMRDMYSEHGLYDKVKPYAGASECLQRLISDGHEIYILTDAAPETYAEKIAFIKKCFPFINESKIVCIKHKWMFKVDVLIEDNLANLLAKPYYHRICFDQPWNRSVSDLAYSISRVRSWAEIYDVVNKFNDME